MDRPEQNIQPSVGIICFRSDDVLLIERGTAPFRGEWSIPGGKIEFGESATTAALRELSEETCVEAELLGLCNVVDAIISSRKTGKVTRHYLLCNYVARWKAGIPTASDDAAAARFMSPSDLKDIDLWSETRKTIEMARRQLAASL